MKKPKLSFSFPVQNRMVDVYHRPPKPPKRKNVKTFRQAWDWAYSETSMWNFGFYYKAREYEDDGQLDVASLFLLLYLLHQEPSEDPVCYSWWREEIRRVGGGDALQQYLESGLTSDIVCKRAEKLFPFVLQAMYNKNESRL